MNIGFFFTSWASCAFFCSIMNFCSLFSLCSRATAFSSNLFRISLMYLSLDCKISFAPFPETSKSWWLAPRWKVPGEGWPLQRSQNIACKSLRTFCLMDYIKHSSCTILQDNDPGDFSFPHLVEVEMYVTNFFLFVSNWAISFWTIWVDKMQ